MADGYEGESPGQSREVSVTSPKDKHGLSRDDHRHLARAWEMTISAGIQHRKPFMKAYREGERFAYESHDFLYEGVYENKDMRSTVPKVWEMVNIFGPMVSYREPFRRVRGRYEMPQDPRAPFAAVMQNLLNVIPYELDWRRETRHWTDEAIVGGLGVMWLERDEKTGLIGHLHDSCKNLVVDPDASKWRDAWWIARRRRLPRWVAARELGISEDDPRLPRQNLGIEDLKPSSDPVEGTFGHPEPLTERSAGMTSELVELWEVFSKMGIGWRLKEAKYRTYGREPFEDYPRFFIVPGSQRIWLPGEWPVPLWADNDWPIEFLGWRYRPGHVWPTSMIRPVLGMQKALDWFVTLFLQKLKTTCRDFVAIAKDMEPELVEKIRNGVDLEVLDIDPVDLEDKRIQDMVQFLQHPPMNTDLWRIYELLQALFERSSGLYAPLYSESGETQARSATESQRRETRADLRPDDMRNEVENCHARMARREAIAARLHYDPQFIDEVLGPPAGEVWKQYQDGDLKKVMREYEYRIEVGSTAKPDLDKEHRDSLEVFDRAMQVAVQVGDFNAMNKLLDNLQKSLNVLEADRVYIQPPQPQPDPAQQKAEAEIEATKQKMELDAQKAQLDAHTKMQKAQTDLQVAQIKAMGDVKMQDAKLQHEEAAGSQKLRHAEVAHRQKLEHNDEMAKAKAKAASKPKPKGGK